MVGNFIERRLAKGRVRSELEQFVRTAPRSEVIPHLHYLLGELEKRLYKRAAEAAKLTVAPLPGLTVSPLPAAPAKPRKGIRAVTRKRAAKSA